MLNVLAAKQLVHFLNFVYYFIYIFFWSLGSKIPLGEIVTISVSVYDIILPRHDIALILGHRLIRGALCQYAGCFIKKI